ncbi:MAG: ROK family protein [Acidimicrobiia bacterium]|nr:ROK family protein [Acidimicrobiia bacterium]
MSLVGIDLGGTKLAAVRIREGEIVARARIPNTSQAEGLVDCARAGIESVWDVDVAAVGVGVAGLVSWPEGVFAWGPHVAGIGIPLRAALETRLGVPVVVDNDANTALHAEMVEGAGVGSSELVMVTVGTGIGGAIAFNGTVRRGRSFAGEFGHIAVTGDGEPCACGRRGCWETEASGPALSRLASLGGIVDTAPEAVVAAAAAGDEAAEHALTRVGEALGRGVISLVLSLDPEVVIVGGGLGSIGDALLEPARAVVDADLPGRPNRKAPPIVAARFGDEGGAIGAAMLAGIRLQEDQR